MPPHLLSFFIIVCFIIKEFLFVTWGFCCSRISLSKLHIQLIDSDWFDLSWTHFWTFVVIWKKATNWFSPQFMSSSGNDLNYVIQAAWLGPKAKVKFCYQKNIKCILTGKNKCFQEITNDLISNKCFTSYKKVYLKHLMQQLLQMNKHRKIVHSEVIMNYDLQKYNEYKG